MANAGKAAVSLSGQGADFLKVSGKSAEHPA